MCQICPVSGVPYLCIEVHVQTFIYAFLVHSLQIPGQRTAGNVFVLPPTKLSLKTRRQHE